MRQSCTALMWQLHSNPVVNPSGHALASAAPSQHAFPSRQSLDGPSKEPWQTHSAPTGAHRQPVCILSTTQAKRPMLPHHAQTSSQSAAHPVAGHWQKHAAAAGAHRQSIWALWRRDLYNSSTCRHARSEPTCILVGACVHNRHFQASAAC